MPKYLIVGGQHDGKWTEDLDDRIKNIKAPKLKPFDFSQLPNDLSLITIEAYTRREIAEKKCRYVYFCLNTISNGDSLRMLIEGYRKPKSDDEV